MNKRLIPAILAATVLAVLPLDGAFARGGGGAGGGFGGGGGSRGHGGDVSDGGRGSVSYSRPQSPSQQRLYDEARKSCHDAAQQLALCMQATPCVAGGRDIMECLRAKEIGDCERYRTAYYLCRRSQLDMRTRIRGKKYADNAASTDDDA